jgi:protein-disulfide isomerase
MYSTLYAHQDELSDADLERYATRAGVDLATWEACLTARSTRQRIAIDTDEADRAGVRGTPTFFLNAKVVRGAEPFSEFAEVIDAELAVAESSGIARTDYFAEGVMARCEE